MYQSFNFPTHFGTHKNVNKTNNSLTAAASLTATIAIKSGKEASGDSGSGGRTPTTSVRN